MVKSISNYIKLTINNSSLAWEESSHFGAHNVGLMDHYFSIPVTNNVKIKYLQK